MTTNISFSDEELDIISRGKANGTYMKAPDGSPTSLNEKQWAQVRTKAFKEWFGDWENAPETASKVVGSNGEPLVVYHGSQESFYEFNRWTDGFINSGHFFSPDKMNASGYGRNVYDVYLNLRNPLKIDAQGANFSSIEYSGKKMAASDLGNLAEMEGYDGVVISDVLDSADMGIENVCTVDYISFAPDQIKSASQNTGSFLAFKSDIRFREVWHGSPSSFTGFDHAFLGTGEGAQAYGWGTYVTEVEGIARRYAAIGIRRGGHITYNGEDFSTVLDNEHYFDDVWRVWKTHLLSSTDPDTLKQNIASVYIDGRTASPRSKRRKEFERQKAELLADIDNGKIRVDLPRNLYAVNIPDDSGINYLYWDRPVSPEQQERIFLQLRKERLFWSELTAEFWNGKSRVWTSGKEFYSFLDYMFMNPDRDTDSQRLASGFLSRAGFTGIDYPAEYSTGGRADGARNCVIFKEGDLKIVSHERFRFIGEAGAANLDRTEGTALRLNNLAIAGAMESSGKDAGAIKMATGWERGADRKWRYETADFEYFPSGNRGCSRLLESQPWHKDFESLLDRLIAGETLPEAEQKRFEELTDLATGLERQDALRDRIYLDDYVEDDGLFRAYPRLKQTRLEFLDLPSADYAGAYLPVGNRIIINTSKADDTKSVLAHEIQHAIQHIEGFARGSSPEEFKSTAEDVILDIVRATDGRLLEGGGFDNTPDGIFAALNRKTAYGGTILRDNSSSLDAVAGKYGYETIFDLVNDIGSFRSSIQMYRSTAGEVEDRNVQKRMDMTMPQRRGSLAVLTEDIPRGQQILLSGDSADSLAEYAGSLAEKQHIPVRIIRSAGEVDSPEAFRLISAGKDIRGWYDINSDRVCLYLPNARGKEDIARTILHEGVAHYGLRKLAGRKHMDAFLDDVFSACGERIRGDIVRMSALKGYDIRTATEEYLAYMAEKGTDLSLWNRIAVAFRNLLRKLGFGLDIGTRELRAILSASRQNLAREAISAGPVCDRDSVPIPEQVRKAGIGPTLLGKEGLDSLSRGKPVTMTDGRVLLPVKKPSGYSLKIMPPAAGCRTRTSEMEL